MKTDNLELVLYTPEKRRKEVAAAPAEMKAQMSPVWLAQLASSTSPDPWIHGFEMVERDSREPVGQCGYKGPPNEGVVEIAYGVEQAHQGKGYATEAARALTDYAFSSGRVRIVRAHTLPQPNASTRVLTKCGFRHIGEVIDPEDGLVWRWEKEISE